jgi:hypothetical protein
MFKRYIVTLVLTALLFTHALAGTFTRNPTANETPDSGQGGLAVTGNINTGHGSTTASRVGAGNQSKTCRWSGFAAGPGGNIVSVLLKFDWSENGSVANGGSNQFRVQYSTNGGGAWTNVFDHLNVTSSTTSSSQVTLSNTQNLTQVQVRDILAASGGDVGDSGSVTASVSNIRIEITTSDGNVIAIM